MTCSHDIFHWYFSSGNFSIHSTWYISLLRGVCSGIFQRFHQNVRNWRSTAETHLHLLLETLCLWMKWCGSRRCGINIFEITRLNVITILTLRNGQSQEDLNLSYILTSINSGYGLTYMPNTKRQKYHYTVSICCLYNPKRLLKHKGSCVWNYVVLFYCH